MALLLSETPRNYCDHQNENIHFIASRTYLLFYYEDSLSFYGRCWVSCAFIVTRLEALFLHAGYSIKFVSLRFQAGGFIFRNTSVVFAS